MWRTVGPCRAGILSYVDDTAAGYIKEGFCALAANGDLLIHQFGRLYQTPMEFQESEMRTHSEQMVFANENRVMFPTQ